MNTHGMIAQGNAMHRRKLLASIAALVTCQPRGLSARAVTLATAEIEVTGDWRRSLPQSAAAVVIRMREVCLAGVPLLSDRQPTRLRVESRVSGGPSIWLHRTSPSLAWINVNISERDWCKLAYQFGHELGHVLANSWVSDAIPTVPCQWLEEALVEAFSIRGLGLLADSWAHNPPFPGDQAFAESIRQYRNDARKQYVARAASQGAIADPRGWFRAHRGELERQAGLSEAAGVLVPALLAALETDFKCVAELGALNRWPERTNLELDAYLSAWVTSCSQIGCERNLAELVRQWSRE